MYLRRICMLVLATAVLSRSLQAAEDSRLRAVDPDPQTGFAAAMLVDDVALAHTSLILPVRADGELIGSGDAAAQTRALLKHLASVLKLSGTDEDRLVKLNLYLAADDVAVAVQQVLRDQFARRAKPAISFVSGTPAKPGVLVALDAVAAVPGDGPDKVTYGTFEENQQDRPALVTILPQGGVIYISGQAEQGETLAECTRNTLASLQRTLEFLKLDRMHVVQIKSFLNPMSQLDAVEREIAAHFRGGPIPAHVPVEWTSAGLIEIELIAVAPQNVIENQNDALIFQTPPGMTASPVFSRLAVAKSGKRLYVSGLYGDKSSGEIPQIFERLKAILQTTGSDFDQLAKATYYVSNSAASGELNEYRPTVYNPLRPPAASKAPVRSVGREGRSITLDMIAVVPE